MILWQKNYKFDSTLVDDLMFKLINDKRSFDINNKYHTSYFLSSGDKPENILHRKYKKICTKVSKDLGLHHRASLTFATWMQVYTNKSKLFAPHDHFSGNELLSWVHFLKEPGEQCFCFLDSEGNKTYPQVESGDLIVFPSWVWHEASPPKSEGYRMIIAGNIHASVMFIKDKSKNQSPKMIYDKFENEHGGTWRFSNGL